MRQLVFLPCAPALDLVGKIIVDLAIRDEYLALDLALAQPDNGHSARISSRKRRIAYAVLFQRQPELLRRQLVVGSDAGHRLVELRVIHPQAGLARELHLHPVHDHPLQHLALEHILRRQVGVLFLQLLERGCVTLPQIVLRDDLVADDRDDTIGLVC